MCSTDGIRDALNASGPVDRGVGHSHGSWTGCAARLPPDTCFANRSAFAAGGGYAEDDREASIIIRMRLQRSGTRFAMVATVAALILTTAVAIIAVTGTSRGGAAAFNTCINRTGFLVLAHHKSGNKVIETIEDRAHRAVVGEFAVLRSAQAADPFPTTLAGSGAQNGRYVISTKDAVSRYAGAIKGCFDRILPLVPR